MKRKVKFQEGGMVETPAERRVRLADEARTRSLELRDYEQRLARQQAGSQDAVRQLSWLSEAANDMRQLSETVLPAQTGPLALAAGVQLARHCMAQLSPVTYRLALQAQASFDRDAALAHIHVPTLLIAGEHDRCAPLAAIERMAGKIQGSRWVQMPGVGHWQHLEAPDAFDALVLDFLHERSELRLH